MNLGSRRLVAADDYRNTTNGYSGIRADLGLADDISATLIYTLPQVRLFGSVSASLAPTAATLKAASWFAHIEAGFTFRHPWSPHISVEFDYASGDGRGARFGRFDTLFGMRRSDLAPAGLYNAVGRANLISPGLRLELTPSKRLDGFAAYHPLWLASRTDSFSTTGVRDAAGNSGRFAGHQLEGRIRYWLVPKRLRLEWNSLFLAKGRFLRDAPNAPAGGDTIYNSFNATVNF